MVTVASSSEESENLTLAAQHATGKRDGLAGSTATIASTTVTRCSFCGCPRTTTSWVILALLSSTLSTEHRAFGRRSVVHSTTAGIHTVTRNAVATVSCRWETVTPGSPMVSRLTATTGYS